MRLLWSSSYLLCLLAATVAGAQPRPAGAARPDEANPGALEAPLDEKVRGLEGQVDDLSTRAFQIQVRALDLRESAPDPASGAKRFSDDEAPLVRARRRYSQGIERARAGDHAGAATLLGAAIDSGPFRDTGDFPIALFELGEALRQQGLWAAARPYYRRVLEQPSSPRAKEALVRAIEAEIHLGRPARVPDLVSLGRRAWGDAGLPPEALYLAGKAAFRRDDLRPADRDREALAIFAAVPAPFEIAAAYHRGAIRVRAGDLRDGIKEFEGCGRAVVRNARQTAQRLQCWLALARIHGEAGDYQEATHWYGRVLRESPGTDEARYEMAVEYEQLGLNDAALRTISSIQDDDPGSALANEVEILRGQILTSLRRYPEATALYDRLRRSHTQVRDQVDAVRVAGRYPERCLARVAGSAGDRATSSGNLPPWVVERARASGGMKRGLDLVRRLAIAEKALADATAAVDRADRAPPREGDDARRARISDARRELAEATAYLERLQAEARPLAGQQACRALEAAREHSNGMVLRADWGDVEVALARHAELRGDVRSRLSRHAAEDYWPSSIGRRRTRVESLGYRSRLPDPEERKAQEEAIALLEDYLRRHPDDPAYTPRALAVLAELQYESAAADASWAMTGGRGPATPTAGEAPLATKGCASAIDLYKRLATGFPDYKGKDEIYFLLGYCLGETGRRPEAIRAYATLVKKFPQSAHAPEAWVRIGDLSFEEAGPGSLERAVEAYEKLSAWPDHPLYPHAAYMLGWTWYRGDDLQQAVNAFTSLLDRLSEEAKVAGDRPDDDLGSEALRYIAASFANPRWDGIRKAREWSVRVQGRPYQAAVQLRLADLLFDQGRVPQAVEALKLVIAADPLSAEAPRLQARIVEAWSRERRADEEARARDTLLTTYAEDGEWWRRHQLSPELLRQARDLRLANERTAATLQHGQAQALRKAGRSGEALAAYRSAEQGYERYLRAVPDAKDAYELRFAWADAAYQAGDYEKAARAYERVRDDASSSKHKEEAALDAVLAWEADAARARKSGTLEERKVVLAKDLHGKPPAAEPLPAPLVALVRASDHFVGSFPRHERAPAIAYRAGEIFYTYGHYEESRSRLEDVAERWPGTEVARYAANLVIETHLAAKNWTAVESAAARLQAAPAARDAALAASLHKVELGSRFNRAQALLEQRQLEPAADLFLAIAAEDPRGEFADKALFNAASALESARRLDRAMPAYEQLLAAHPKSSLAEEALFRLAWHADGIFDFEKAADLYGRLVERYPKSKHRDDAILNGARALENLQRHDAAAETLFRFAKAHPGTEEAAGALFRSALLYGKARAWAKEIQALRVLATDHAGTAKADVLVQAHLRMGLAHRALDQEKPALREFAAAVAEYPRASAGPDASAAAAAAAAEAQFRLAEAELEKFDRIALPATTNPKKLQQPLEAKLSELKRVARLYDDVKAYKRPDWTIAAFYRQAYLLEQFAKTIYDAPLPPELKKRGQEEYLAAYQDQLARFAQPYEDQAVEVYEKALAAARDLHVKSEWTTRIRQALARHRPKDHPLLREARGRLAGQVAQGASAGEGAARATLTTDAGNVPAMVALALAFEAQGRLEAARTVLESARQAAPDDATVWNRMAFVQRALGDGPRALESWRKASELRPDLVEALVNYGFMLVETEDHAGAQAVLERAVQMAPNDATAWLDLGNACRGAGRGDAARRAYEAALGADPAMADAWFNLGVLALEGEPADMPATARLEKALECFDRFVAAGGPEAVVDAPRREARSLLARERRRLAGDGPERAGRDAVSAQPSSTPNPTEAQ